MSERKSNSPGESPDQQSPTFANTTDNHSRHSAQGDHESNNHFALLYETQEAQLSVAIPFIREGLRQNEQCLYVVDDNTEDAVLTAMREAGIDVETRRESGQLVIHNATNTYLRTGSFDREAMLDFWENALVTAYDKEYVGIRAAAEMTWALESNTNLDSLATYEESLNNLYSGEDYVVLCQYNRNRFPPELLSEIISNHPKIVCDDTVTENFYYIPPGEEINQDHSSQHIDWQLQSLVERTRVEGTLKYRERGLHSLTEATQALMRADPDELSDRIADLVRDVLDVEFASYWPYNQHTGKLELHSSSTELETGVKAIAERYRERAWETFITEQTDTSNDLPSASKISAAEKPLRSGVIVPLGRHGVFCAGSRHPDVFDKSTINLAKMVGTSIERALDTVNREQVLEEKNAKLERLSRINSVIREISNALVEAETRTDIEEMVCKQLARSDPYQFVWIGEQDVGTQTIIPRAQAGIQNGYLDSVTIRTDETLRGQGPSGRAMRTKEVQITHDILTDQSFTPWREEALTHGFRSCITIPLVYNQSFFGVLNLYTDTPNLINEMEQEVLGELGETIAHSIDAVQTKATLRTDNITELTITVRGSDDVLSRLAHAAGCEIDFDGIVPQPDAPARHFFTVQDVDPAAVLASSEQLTGISAITLIRDDDAECTFEATISEPTIASRTLNQGAVIRSLSVTGDTSTVVVDLPSTTNVRSFIETMRTTDTTLDLVGRHTRDRPVTSNKDLADVLDEQLTDRQREILETAYLSGFFESPRARTGKELSNALEISQSTFTHHLREAERKLCGIVFENT